MREYWGDDAETEKMLKDLSDQLIHQADFTRVLIKAFWAGRESVLKEFRVECKAMQSTLEKAELSAQAQG